MNLTIQQPLIYLRDLSKDFPDWNLKEYPIGKALTILSLYQPITPYLTIGLNFARSIPTFRETIQSIKEGKIDLLTQLMSTAYRISLIGITVINPVAGMLLICLEDNWGFLKDLQELYSEGNFNIKNTKLIFAMSFLLLGNCLHLLSFFKSDLRLLAITMGGEVLLRAYSIFKSGIDKDALFNILMIMIRGYQYQLAVNSPAVDQPEHFEMRVGGVMPFQIKP